MLIGLRCWLRNKDRPIQMQLPCWEWSTEPSPVDRTAHESDTPESCVPKRAKNSLGPSWPPSEPTHRSTSAAVLPWGSQGGQGGQSIPVRPSWPPSTCVPGHDWGKAQNHPPFFSRRASSAFRSTGSDSQWTAGEPSDLGAMVKARPVPSTAGYPCQMLHEFCCCYGIAGVSSGLGQPRQRSSPGAAGAFSRSVGDEGGLCEVAGV